MQILPVFLIITNNTIIRHFYIAERILYLLVLRFPMTIFSAQYMTSVNVFFKNPKFYTLSSKLPMFTYWVYVMKTYNGFY